MFHGAPCWFELSTSDPAVSQAFYGPLLGWSFVDAGMEGMSYTLATAGGDMVAGLMQPDSPMPEFWMTYVAVDDCDAAAAKVQSLGGSLHRAPEDIPGTGRFAIVTDPQGVAFGLLQPLDGDSAAFDQAKPGHGHWIELNSTDPVAGLAFYTEMFGWTASAAMPMGEMGTYQIFARKGGDIGGMARLQGAGGLPPHWLPYFGVPSAKAAKAAIEAGGGSVAHGPVPVPGGAFVVIAVDPKGAFFGVVGPA